MVVLRCSENPLRLIKHKELSLRCASAGLEIVLQVSLPNYSYKPDPFHSALLITSSMPDTANNQPYKTERVWLARLARELEATKKTSCDWLEIMPS